MTADPTFDAALLADLVASGFGDPSAAINSANAADRNALLQRIAARLRELLTASSNSYLTAFQAAVTACTGVPVSFAVQSAVVNVAAPPPTTTDYAPVIIAGCVVAACFIILAVLFFTGVWRCGTGVAAGTVGAGVFVADSIPGSGLAIVVAVPRKRGAAAAAAAAAAGPNASTTVAAQVDESTMSQMYRFADEMAASLEGSGAPPAHILFVPFDSEEGAAPGEGKLSRTAALNAGYRVTALADARDACDLPSALVRGGFSRVAFHDLALLPSALPKTGGDVPGAAVGRMYAADPANRAVHVGALWGACAPGAEHVAGAVLLSSVAVADSNGYPTGASLAAAEAELQRRLRSAGVRLGTDADVSADSVTVAVPTDKKADGVSTTKFVLRGGARIGSAGTATFVFAEALAPQAAAGPAVAAAPVAAAV